MGLRIQFLGLVGSGKSHVSRDLASKSHGYVLPFAKEVYRLSELVKGAPVDKSLPADRDLLRLVGTTWGRDSQQLSPNLQAKLEAHKPAEWGTPDIWAMMFIANCRRLPPNAAIFNDDTRFANELRIADEMMGFIPVFVKCRETTRLQRLGKRGENYDSNDPGHKSEVLINRLNASILEKDILTVVWNDDAEHQPERPWVHSVEDFTRLVLSCDSNAELKAALNWTRARANQLLAFVADAQEDSMHNLHDLVTIKSKDVAAQRSILTFFTDYCLRSDQIDLLAIVREDGVADFSREPPERLIRYCLLAIYAEDVTSVPDRETRESHLVQLRKLIEDNDLTYAKVGHLVRYANRFLQELEENTAS